MTRPRLARLLALAGSALPLLAAAHTGGAAPHDHGTLSSLAAGFSHPFTGLDHLAAMVALGVWSAMTSRRMWLAPVAFASALLAGALLGLAGLALPAVEPMIATSLLVLGLLVATGRQLPATAGAALAAVFALFHGVAHGTELAGPGTAAAVTGMVAATALLHGAGIGLGLALRGTNRWLPRLAGAGVAVFGLALLA
ncbi:HupE/UreJ family protein [Rhizobacter sp. Root1221]|uniref:HupE/UreJ family protein n=1 Tax=Rhizobacter sp. Root1221 TaxID=1736433 RepID=UPI0006F2A3EA|nr:HupE/UreJ family protein [Rhizobacter sp. Root1221]KQV95855.1 urease accessory protein UreJ [Rhizobacter sp. Root1221]